MQRKHNKVWMKANRQQIGLAFLATLITPNAMAQAPAEGGPGNPTGLAKPSDASDETTGTP